MSRAARQPSLRDWASKTPTGSWVLHTVPELGTITEGWIESQIAAQRQFDALLLGGAVAESNNTRAPHWLVARDRLLSRIAHRLMYRTGGLSLALLAPPFIRHRPSLIHAHHGTAAAMHIWFARALRVPLVASFYGADACSHSITRSPYWARRYRRLFAFAVAVFVEGPAMRRRLIDLGCPPGKLHVVRLPVDADGLKDLTYRPPAIFEIAAAGRFIEKKGFETAIKAFAASLAGREARLALVGGGPLEADLRSLATELGIDDQVTFTGRLPFHTFAQRVLDATLSIYPSREARDGDSDGGAPVALIEAQWAGQPVLISDHDDLPFVTPASTPRLPVDDIAAWGEALRDAFESPAALQTIAARGAAFVHAHHTPEANATERERVYASVVADAAHLGRASQVRRV